MSPCLFKYFSFKFDIVVKGVVTLVSSFYALKYKERISKFVSYILFYECSSSLRMQSSYSVSTRICWIWDKVIFPVVYRFLSPGVPMSKLNLWELLHFLVLLTVDTFVGDIELTRRNETDMSMTNTLVQNDSWQIFETGPALNCKWINGLLSCTLDIW